MAAYVDLDVPVDLTNSAAEALGVARDTGIVEKGTSETAKFIKQGNAQLVLIAEDVSLEEIVVHLPELADGKGIPLIFVETQDDIGHAAGLGVGNAAAAIVSAGDTSDDVEDTATKVEDLR